MSTVETKQDSLVASTADTAVPFLLLAASKPCSYPDDTLTCLDQSYSDYNTDWLCAACTSRIAIKVLDPFMYENVLIPLLESTEVTSE